MVQNLTFNTDLILPQTLGFIKDLGDCTLDVIKSPVPICEGCQAAKVMVLGFHQDVDWNVVVSLDNGKFSNCC